jgi:hypothetical protein
MIVALAYCKIGVGQSITPWIQNSAGNSTKSSSYFLDFSIGELTSVKDYFSTEKTNLSSGFLHANLPLVTAIYDQKHEVGEYVIIVPNPVSYFLTIKANYQIAGKFRFKIVDINAATIYQSDFIKINGYYFGKINVNRYASGTYYLHCLFEGINGKIKSNTLKIIKI